MDKKERIECLKFYAKSWFATAEQNAIHAEIDKCMGYTKIAEKLQEEANDEFAEAQKIVARLLRLGEKPDFDSLKLPVYYDVKEQLEAFIPQFDEAIPQLNELANAFSDDYVTKKMVEDFIEGESDHREWVMKHLSIIDKIGYENYLIEQLDF